MESNFVDAGQRYGNNNFELAKALAENKVSLKQVSDERDYLQRQNMILEIRNAELVRYIKLINQSACKSINSLVASSNFITDIAQMSRAGIQKSEGYLIDKFNEVSSSPNTSRLNAVKPMIDGHVIHRPTISLRRVNEMPVQENGLTINSQAQTSTNRANLSTTQSPAPDTVTYRRVSTIPATNNAYSFNDQSNQNSVDELGNEVDDVYVEQSPNVSQSEPNENNRLHTIEELSESLINGRLSEDLSTTANVCTSNISVPAHTAQGPLLSGVFRDVRVFLSPMQNAPDYLEALSGIRTEGVKVFSNNITKRPHSSRNARANENSENVSSSKLVTSNLTSANNSFDEPNNSILTSTRINNNLEDASSSCNTENERLPCSNSIQDRDITGNVLSTNSPMKSCFDQIASYNSKKRSSTTQNYSPYHRSAMTSSAYDPLEGPSTFLDTTNSSKRHSTFSDSASRDNEKLLTLSSLGLKPKCSEQLLQRKPSSPAITVLKRRNREIPEETASQEKSIYVTKRREIMVTNKKSSALETGRCTIKLTPMTVPKPEKPSINPLKEENLNVSSRRYRRIKDRLSISRNRSSSSTSSSSSMEIVEKRISKKKSKNSGKRAVDIKSKSSQKTTKKRRLDVAENRSIDKSSEYSKSPQKSPSKRKVDVVKNGSLKKLSVRSKSPQKSPSKRVSVVKNGSLKKFSVHSKSPQKTPRKKRVGAAKIGSLKEPSVGRKMRRS